MSKQVNGVTLKSVIERFDHATHDRTVFNCARADTLESYVRPGGYFERDVIDAKVVGAWVWASDENKLVGYYTLGMYTIDRDVIPSELSKKKKQEKFPYKTIGLVILSRIAICDELKGNGVGTALIYDALYRAKSLGEPLGAQGVFLNARNESVERIYQNIGFIKFPEPNEDRKMFFDFKLLETETKG